MGREVRKVAADWEHPTDENGDYIPLHGGSYQQRLAEYNLNVRQWAKGMRRSYSNSDEWVPLTADECRMTFAQWDGDPPVESDYMPDWPAGERTHFQYYESTTEGTPLSPPMPSVEALAHWLAENKVAYEGFDPADVAEWLSFLSDDVADIQSQPQLNKATTVDWMAEDMAKLIDQGVDVQALVYGRGAVPAGYVTVAWNDVMKQFEVSQSARLTAQEAEEDFDGENYTIISTIVI